MQHALPLTTPHTEVLHCLATLAPTPNPVHLERAGVTGAFSPELRQQLNPWLWARLRRKFRCKGIHLFDARPRGKIEDLQGQFMRILQLAQCTRCRQSGTNQPHIPTSTQLHNCQIGILHCVSNLPGEACRGHMDMTWVKLQEWIYVNVSFGMNPRAIAGASFSIPNAHIREAGFLIY